MRGHDVGCVAEDKRVSRLIVAIDGPAGVGKSTVAQLLASRLGYLYLDTGALYRALAWAVIESGRDPADAEAMIDEVRGDPACLPDVGDHDVGLDMGRVDSPG